MCGLGLFTHELFYECSKLLYDLTHKDSTSPSESVVKHWIGKINESVHAGLLHTERLAGVLINRANFIRRKSKTLGGGRTRQVFLDQKWELTVHQDELSQAASKENSTLKEQVQTLETHLEATTRILRNIQPTASSSGHKRTPKRYSKRQERRIKKRRVEECAAALSWLEEGGLTPVKITVLNSETQRLESIALKEDIEKALGVQGENLTHKDQDIVSMMLYVKDRYNISGSAYHEMASLCRQMPRHYCLKQRISELNAQWNIQPTPEGTEGVQQSLIERLVICVERMVSIKIPSPNYSCTHTHKTSVCSNV